jgi:RimJ/RimL family protein N-acetyltransferase
MVLSDVVAETRAPRVEDVPALAALINDLAREPNLLFIMPIEGASGVTALRGHLASIAVSGSGFVLVADRGGDLVGLATATRGHHPARRNAAEIGIGVCASARGRGIGRALMLGVEHWAAQAGIRRLHLSVVTTNAPAVALYRRLGFAEEGILRASAKVDGGFVDELAMAKLL